MRTDQERKDLAAQLKANLIIALQGFLGQPTGPGTEYEVLATVMHTIRTTVPESINGNLKYKIVVRGSDVDIEPMNLYSHIMKVGSDIPPLGMGDHEEYWRNGNRVYLMVNGNGYAVELNEE